MSRDVSFTGTHVRSLSHTLNRSLTPSRNRARPAAFSARPAVRHRPRLRLRGRRGGSRPPHPALPPRTHSSKQAARSPALHTVKHRGAAMGKDKARMGRDRARMGKDRARMGRGRPLSQRHSKDGAVVRARAPQTRILFPGVALLRLRGPTPTLHPGVEQV